MPCWLMELFKPFGNSLLYMCGLDWIGLDWIVCKLHLRKGGNEECRPSYLYTLVNFCMLLLLYSSGPFISISNAVH